MSKETTYEMHIKIMVDRDPGQDFEGPEIYYETIGYDHDENEVTIFRAGPFYNVPDAMKDLDEDMRNFVETY